MDELAFHYGTFQGIVGTLRGVDGTFGGNFPLLTIN